MIYQCDACLEYKKPNRFLKHGEKGMCSACYKASKSYLSGIIRKKSEQSINNPFDFVNSFEKAGMKYPEMKAMENFNARYGLEDANEQTED